MTSNVEDARALARYAPEVAKELKQAVAAIGADEDLTASGRSKKVAAEASRMVAPFAKRVAELDAMLSREANAAEAHIAERVRDAAGMSAAEAAEWRAVLRAMPDADRTALVRGAMSGEAPASSQILGAVLSATSPLLVGIDPAHPILGIVRAAAEEQYASSDSGRLAEIEAARQELLRERDKLMELAGKHGGAVDNHGKRISTLTREEVVDRVRARPDLPFADAIAEAVR